MRPSGRAADELRPVELELGFAKHAEGSCMARFGETHVLCAATIEERVPPFLKNSGTGWVTAEYGMLPRSTHRRTDREAARGRQGGRTMEIQRLIGRSLRAVINLKALGERQIRLDCDVIQADGGTRTAAITGAYVAVALCLKDAIANNVIPCSSLDLVLTNSIAAVSLGIKSGQILTDLCYEEDVVVDTDFNLVARGDGAIVEMQGTAEGAAMTRGEVDQLLSMGLSAIEELGALQRAALK